MYNKEEMPNIDYKYAVKPPPDVRNTPSLEAPWYSVIVHYS